MLGIEAREQIMAGSEPRGQVPYAAAGMSCDRWLNASDIDPFIARLPRG
jgi:hypothetical protein